MEKWKQRRGKGDMGKDKVKEGEGKGNWVINKGMEREVRKDGNGPAGKENGQWNGK